MDAKPIRIIVVDDSALARQVITKGLSVHSDIKIVGTATDPYVARDKILELNPDVITLDIEMPRMDGITFLKLIMKHRPMPVVIMSSLTAAGSEKAMEALQAGAVDVIEKPNGSFSAITDGARLAEKIRAAACAHINLPLSSSSTVHAKPVVKRSFPARKLILMGASTGGTEALKRVLTAMPGDLPGICIVQHIPAYFSKAFAARLNQICPMQVREAVNGDVVTQGLALIAPGGYHMLLKWQGNRYVVELNQGPQIHHQRPAVDILFDSAVKAGAGPHVVAALLTGMGSDGAAGMLHLREAGAATIAQSEETCVVFGMPREAVRLGAAGQVLPLDGIASRVDHLVSDSNPGSATARNLSQPVQSIKQNVTQAT